MKKQTQEERVIEVLRSKGEVDNFWAFHNYLLRLGAIIHGLRQKGWDIEGKYDKYGTTGMEKNYYYTLISEPVGMPKS